MTHAILVEEQPVFGILYHPIQPLMKILSCHGTAWQDCPLVGFD